MENEEMEYTHHGGALQSCQMMFAFMIDYSIEMQPFLCFMFYAIACLILNASSL